MAEEMLSALDTRTALGRVLDAQRALARADRAVARSWLF